ncbi:MAG: sulfite exporter TauE/SafE family protein [Desulfobulbaceae bacterium]|nr:sulfite exporter TauE/SafE family protein [Desulfobulbaceae bacterium]
MEFDQLFIITIQSSFILGLVHGVNPCGHSWLVLAPFVSGTKKGGRVAFLTLSFLAGTTFGCLVLGATLGAISVAIPANFGSWVETITSVVLILLGTAMIAKPHLLHHHDHNQDHDHEHGPCSCSTVKTGALKHQKTTGGALFGIGFINMIIPCPTVAIMYGFALESGSYAKALTVFAVYAFSTSLAVGAVIYGIFRLTSLLRTLSQDWIETAIMRTIGAMTVFFGAYSLYVSP